MGIIYSKCYNGVIRVTGLADVNAIPESISRKDLGYKTQRVCLLLILECLRLAC
jgi:hypothetical protein